MKNYYDILGLEVNASSDEIKFAYKALVKKFHPDVNPQQREFFEKKSKAINEAYEILSNPSKKSSYDMRLKEFLNRQSNNQANSNYNQEKEEELKRREEELKRKQQEFDRKQREEEELKSKQTPPTQNKTKEEDTNLTPIFIGISILLFLLLYIALVDKDKFGQQKTESIVGVSTEDLALENSSNGEAKTITEEEKLSFQEIAKVIEQSMVYVQGESFMMGSNDGEADEKPVHKITLSSFKVSKYEVTQAQWKVVMGNNPSKFKDCDNCPVEQVSWNDIQSFLKKINQLTGKNYRLLTEAEWEYAARGGNKSKGYKYAGSNSLGSVAWYDGNSGKKTHPVGQKQPNELGLYDMSGNVGEWCQDWYDSEYYSKSKNLTNPVNKNKFTYKALRGGSWLFDDSYLLLTHRSYNYPNIELTYNGFRIGVSE